MASSCSWSFSSCQPAPRALLAISAPGSGDRHREREVPMKHPTRRTVLAAAPSLLAFAALPARAAKEYGPGVTDSEIKIGNTAFYSGPASSYGTIGKAMAAYYRMINDQGGING